MNQPVKHILLVENSKTAVLSIKRKLSDVGHQVHTVHSGKEAVEAAQNKLYDLIIMDLYLPELNGYEAAQLIRELPSSVAQVPILAYSSSDDPFDQERSKGAGINAYVIKSVDHQALINKITDIFCNQTS